MKNSKVYVKVKFSTSQYKCVFSKVGLFLEREEFLVMSHYCNSIGLIANNNLKPNISNLSYFLFYFYIVRKTDKTKQLW